MRISKVERKSTEWFWRPSGLCLRNVQLLTGGRCWVWPRPVSSLSAGPPHCIPVLRRLPGGWNGRQVSSQGLLQQILLFDSDHQLQDRAFYGYGFSDILYFPGSRRWEIHNLRLDDTLVAVLNGSHKGRKQQMPKSIKFYFPSLKSAIYAKVFLFDILPKVSFRNS